MKLLENQQLTRLPLPPPLAWSSQPVLLPSSPGVYWFLDPDNQVLYVGKAKNLHNRLLSYSRFNQLNSKTRQLIQKTASVRYEILESELHALFVEAELIRLHQPHYNILLKDDKSSLYIVITNETFPRVLTVRKSDLNQQRNKYVFGPFPSSFQTKRVLTMARRLFPYCNAGDYDRSHNRACFYSHIGLCPGVCISQINEADYAKIIGSLALFLRGKHRTVIKELKTSMLAAAKQMEFETAGAIKRKIESIEYVITHHRSKYEDTPLPNITAHDGIYRLSELRRLLEKLHIKAPHLDRIEMYDVANIQGKSAAVSMVVAHDGIIDHQAYRHFSIKTLQQPNDVGMLKEAIGRRLTHPEWGTPALLLVDGGKPQVRAVSSMVNGDILVVGLAKSPDRLVTLLNDEVKILPLDPRNPGAQLVIQLRDEAHRFSRRLHHKHTLKNMFDD